MRTISLEGEQVNVYNINDFPYNILRKCSTVENKKHRYIDIVATFDIETTTIHEEECNIFGRDFGFMYIWQFCLDGYVCIGRTWAEYQEFIYNIERMIKPAELVIWVHNLSFEFQFFRNFFKVKEVFARKERQVVRASVGYCEYRCSWILTNMSLNKFLQKTKGVTFYKRDGDKFDYKVKRYPDTELTDYELEYCICDVLGLWQAIKQQLINDTLLTIPMTSTGYVRRDFRERCLATPGYKSQIWKCALDSETYTVVKEASRGAIAGSNHIHTNKILEEVDSFDIKSSYPFQMCTNYFPQSKFTEYRAKYGSDKFNTLLDNMCCIIVWECSNIRLRKWQSIPYISKAKCRAIYKAKVGNGKVYRAERIGMCCTEVDFRIIQSHYKFDEDSVVIHKLYCAQRGMLAKPFREYLLYMFQQKTDLEDGDPYLYNKFKNKINASFGMMLTDILHPEIVFNPMDKKVWKTNDITNVDEALYEHYKSYSTFLSYQHGVWILAHARKALIDGMDIVGDDLVQVDTDSVKTLGDYKDEFNEINKIIIDKAETYDLKPYSIKNGHKHYLGVWEHEGKDDKYTYEKFKTLGAKKYAVIKEGHNGIETTVSGLSKGAGKWFDDNGGLDKFRIGTVVPPSNSGRTASVYNDLPNTHTIFIDGHCIVLGSNIGINDVSYTLGVAAEWMEMILDGKIDPINEMLYADGAYKGW